MVQMTVNSVKAKLMSHCGTSPSAMTLQLKDEHGSLVATLSSERMLGYYSPHDGCVERRHAETCKASVPHCTATDAVLTLELTSGCWHRQTLHIIDTDPLSASANGWLEDTSKVQKYEMSDEAYDQRENTYRKFKEQKLQVCTLHC